MKRLERLLWSIAFPGFGQLLNKDYIKGIIFIALEIIINFKSHFNQIIAYSFQGNMPLALEEANIGWLMFYPCIYFFSMWDAYKNAGEAVSPLSYLPFAFSAFFVTVGVMYSPVLLPIGGIQFGPVFFPMLCVIPGLIVGFLLKKGLGKKV